MLVNDPRPEHPFDELYTVDYLGNMNEGRPVLYINQPAAVGDCQDISYNGPL